MREVRLSDLGDFAQIALIEGWEIVLVECELARIILFMMFLFMIAQEFRRARFIWRAARSADFGG